MTLELALKAASISEEACKGCRFRANEKELFPYNVTLAANSLEQRRDCLPASHVYEVLEWMETALNTAGFLDTLTGPQERALLSEAEQNSVMLSKLFPEGGMPPKDGLHGCCISIHRVKNSPWFFTALPSGRSLVPHTELNFRNTFSEGLFVDNEVVSWWMLSNRHFLWAFVRIGGPGSTLKMYKLMRSRDLWRWRNRDLAWAPRLGG